MENGRVLEIIHYLRHTFDTRTAPNIMVIFKLCFEMVILRVVENRIGIARCANTGVSALVDPYGRVYQQTDIFRETVIIGSVDLKGKDTFYLRHRDWFPKVSLSISSILLILTPLQYKKLRKKIN